MGALTIRIGFAVFVFLTAAFSVNVFLLQDVGLAGVDGRRAAIDLARTEVTGALGSRDTEAEPDLTSNQGVIVLNADMQVDTIRAIQRELRNRGYDAGDSDGVADLVTRAAIMAYETDHRFPLTGMPRKALLQQILMGTTAEAAPMFARDSEQQPDRDQHVHQVVRTVQQSLQAAGYAPGGVDGKLGPATARAIREFEIDHKMVETGRVSGRLIRRLAVVAGQGKLASR